MCSSGAEVGRTATEHVWPAHTVRCHSAPAGCGRLRTNQRGGVIHNYLKMMAMARQVNLYLFLSPPLFFPLENLKLHLGLVLDFHGAEPMPAKILEAAGVEHGISRSRDFRISRFRISFES